MPPKPATVDKVPAKKAVARRGILFIANIVALQNGRRNANQNRREAVSRRCSVCEGGKGERRVIYFRTLA